MNTGMTLTNLKRELVRQRETRRDYLAPVQRLHFDVDENSHLTMGNPKIGTMIANDWTERQVRDYFHVPEKYWSRMMELAPEIAALNCNSWARKDPAVKMVRTLDGRARAFVSDKYRPLDNMDFAGAALPILERRGANVVSSAVTESRFYLKAEFPWMEAKIQTRKVGDTIRGGICLRNSDVGDGALDLSLFIIVLRCLNGAVAESILKRAHVGKRQGTDLDEASELFSSETKQLDDRALFSKVRDLVEAATERVFFDRYVLKANGAADDVVPKGAKLDDVVEVTLDRFGITPTLKEPVLHNLIEGGDLSRWGLHNAITSVANEQQDYELSTELERVGGKIIDLTSADWNVLVESSAA